MIVVIAEKPSVAKDIGKVIGATSKHDGYLEGNGYQVTWTFGHLCTLKEPHEYTKAWKSWNLSQLPMIPPKFGIKVIDDTGIKHQFEVVRELFSKADYIINAGDAGQEGELIQRWVLQKSGATCPVKRLWVSSMTDEAIRDAFQKIKDGSDYDNLYYAGLCRAIGDWMLGMNATRLYTLRYGGYKQVLSIGRVQTPTLSLIVDRQKEIDNFTPETYWTLATEYRNVIFSATPGKFTSVEEGQKAFASIEGKPFTVTAVDKKKGTEAPPQLYDLTTLQVECNKKYGMTAEQTLATIQSLYEKKLCTYPRVDTRYLPDDVYGTCNKVLQGLPDYAEFVAPLLNKKLPKSKKVFDSSKVTDHHAIIPTGQVASGITPVERNVYDLIARRFIAAFCDPQEYATTTVTGVVDKTEFKASGKQILKPGWTVVYGKDSSDDVLPAFKKGESGPHKPTLTERQTTPPKYYTEATLLRAMETAGKSVDDDELRSLMKENGIGRPSSRAGIIETLFKRGYIRRNKKNIEATETGMALCDVIKEDILKSAELTGQWEKKLRDIEKGTYEPGKFISELKEQLETIVRQVLTDNTDRRIAAEPEPPKKTKKKQG